jgi:hypothetical protein
MRNIPLEVYSSVLACLDDRRLPYQDLLQDNVFMKHPASK